MTDSVGGNPSVDANRVIDGRVSENAEPSGDYEPVSAPVSAPVLAHITASVPGQPILQLPLPPPLDRDSELDESTVEPARHLSLYKLTWLMTILGLMLVSMCIGPYFVEQFEYARTRGRQRAEVDIAKTALGTSALGELTKAYQLVSMRVGPSVVHINVTGADAEDSESLPERRFRDAQGQGSGVVIDANGTIVTNRHVVDGAKEIDVVLSDGRHLAGRVIGLDHLTDLAVVQVDASGLIAAEWGDSEQLEVGALVWAVGSPFGLERSITSGILSAKHRAGRAGTHFQDLMQTDAAINPGNSGGPLVDVTGRVVGINTAIVGQTYSGISFAIPSQIASDVVKRILNDGRVVRGWLGLELDNISAERAEQLGLTDRRGAFVARIVTQRVGEAPAGKAGIEPGDVITVFDGIPVQSRESLIAHVGRTAVGKSVAVIVKRGNEERPFTVVLGERPGFVP